MDPNEALRTLRQWTMKSRYGPNITEEEARQAFEDLDGWLTKGGFLPTDWKVPAIDGKMYL